MSAKLLNADLRIQIVEMVAAAGEGHIPSSFSIVDILNCLYSHFLRIDPKNPHAPDRDRFILSKGHGCAALYAVLYKFGFLSREQILLYSRKGGILGGHPDTTKVPGAEASTGSLGHGFPIAAGAALGLKIQGSSSRVFALLGDGECNEGTIWETALVASKQGLNNLIAIVDLNGSAAQILPVDPLKEKWEAFGWNAIEVDGHNDSMLTQAFQSVLSSPSAKPHVVIAKTVKGKGVSFVEGHGKWHHKIPSQEELSAILKELS